MKRKIARYSALLCAFLAAVTLSAQEYIHRHGRDAGER